jgi:hypothetical protein
MTPPRQAHVSEYLTAMMAERASILLSGMTFSRCGVLFQDSFLLPRVGNLYKFLQCIGFSNIVIFMS